MCLFIFTPRSKNKRICCSISLEDVHVGHAYIITNLSFVFDVMMLLLLFRAIWNFKVRHKEFFTFSVKDRYQLNYLICIKDFNAQTITSLKLNCFISLFTAVSIMNGNRPVLIYFCYQTDSGVPNASIYSAVFLASPYYNYL